MSYQQRVMMELIAKYPYTVTVCGYMDKVRTGRLPKLDVMEKAGHRLGSWVKRRKSDQFAIDRVFGFRTHDELIAFKKAYDLTEDGDGVGI